ncbi:hypothetical protein KYC5002_01070 [Archangium violaceum]|uniref:hypothetical protein n=1 Tax=Archangium violaceum TaxID=83451 RepID=UPI002B3154E8|nr:hypothetical protein F0U59_50135 [Archangium gephyra]WPB77741.1 hypothetical protein KYC5002_01070 [Archangium gephyra]
MTDPDNEWDDLEAGWDATGALVGPTSGEVKARKALMGPTPDEASSLAALRAMEQADEARGTEDSPTAGGKAHARPEEYEGRALDAINDGDGNYLEPPD